MRRKFRVAPLDRTGKLLSNPLTGFLFLLAGILWWILPFPFAPRGYLVSPEGITIRALVTSYVIPKNKAATTRWAAPRPLPTCWQT